MPPNSSGSRSPLGADPTGSDTSMQKRDAETLAIERLRRRAADAALAAYLTTLANDLAAGLVSHIGQA
jgi:hypothetical protein